MPLPFVEQRQFYLAFPAAAQFGGKYPFIMIQELPLCSQTNHIVLIHGIQFRNILLSSYPRSMTKVAFSNKAAARSIAEKVILLMDVKPFHLKNGFLENRLTG